MPVSLQVRSLAPRGLRSKMLQFRRGEMSCHVTCANFSRQGEIVATYNDEVLPAVACDHPSQAALLGVLWLARCRNVSVTCCRTSTCSPQRGPRWQHRQPVRPSWAPTT